MPVHAKRPCRRPRSIAIMLAICAMAMSAASASATRTFGWLEWAYIEPNHVKIKAKLDTGAKTSSIHAEDIERFERNGDKWVRFRIPISERQDDSTHRHDVFMERPIVRDVLIKEHHGEGAERLVVNIDVCLGGMTFTTPMTLADRSRFNYPLLVGRIALQGRAVVDAGRKYVNRRRCKVQRGE